MLEKNLQIPMKSPVKIALDLERGALEVWVFMNQL
jgi:hypothetical protein